MDTRSVRSDDRHSREEKTIRPNGSLKQRTETQDRTPLYLARNRQVWLVHRGKVCETDQVTGRWRHWAVAQVNVKKLVA